jgi:3-methyladenine DNA glycosylase/8-oxoguanine DNA glycosylase
MSVAFGYDPAAAADHLRQADPVLASVVDRIGPITLELLPARSLFEALLRSVVYQQLHGKAAATIHDRVLRLLRPHGGPRPEALEYASDDQLRAAGLSRAKLASVRDLAGKCLAGVVPSLAAARRSSDEELLARLTEVRGIGPWTVHMLLIFHLGRPDVMPTGDFAIRLAIRRLYRKRREPSAESILRHARRWQPYRSAASWSLWRSLDTP